MQHPDAAETIQIYNAAGATTETKSKYERITTQVGSSSPAAIAATLPGPMLQLPKRRKMEEGELGSRNESDYSTRGSGQKIEGMDGAVLDNFSVDECDSNSDNKKGGATKPIGRRSSARKVRRQDLSLLSPPLPAPEAAVIANCKQFEAYIQEFSDENGEFQLPPKDSHHPQCLKTERPGSSKLVCGTRSRHPTREKVTPRLQTPQAGAVMMRHGTR